MTLAKYQKIVARLTAKRDLVLRQIKTEKRALRKLRRRTKAVVSAQGILQEIAQTVQQQAHDNIAKVVTRCLEAIFDGEYQFQILFERKRGKTEARLVFLQNGNMIDPRETGSGGVIDVAAFALRLARLLWARPSLRKFTVLDEPFRFMHSDTLSKIEQLISKLSTDLKVQFVIVTQAGISVGKMIQV